MPNSFRRGFCFSVLVSVCTAAFGAADRAEIESFVDALARKGMAEAHVPGMVVVLVQDGRTVFAKGYGRADLARGTAMTPQTELRAGSVSKPVSAAAVMTFVQDGTLALDAPIDRYLPRLLPADGYGRASTVSQLLTMTGGYGDDVLEVHVPAGARCPSLGEFLQARTPPRQVQPGVMSYSSWGIALLGRAMERIAGEPFDRILQQRIFAPLHMTHSTFAQPVGRDLAANLAAGFIFIDGHFEPVPYDQVPLSPGIGLVTTGEDMGRFMAALMPADGSSIFDEATLHGLLQRQAAMHPLLRGRSYGFSETTFGPPGTLYHDGNGIGFGSRMILVPQQRIGVFVSANHRALDHSLGLTPAFRFVRETAVKLLEKVAPGERPEQSLMPRLPDAAQRAPRYEGQYQTASVPMNNLLRMGRFLDLANVRANGDGTLSIGAGRYAEVEPGLFQNQKWPDVLALFQEDAAGQVRYLSFGGTGTYERVPWFDRLGVQAGVDLMVILLSVAAVVLWIVGRSRRSPLSLFAALANIGFIAGFAVYMSRGDLLLLFKEVPLTLTAVLVLPWIAAALAAATILRWLAVSPQGKWSAAVPVLASVSSMLLVGQVLYLHLLPW